MERGVFISLPRPEAHDLYFCFIFSHQHILCIFLSLNNSSLLSAQLIHLLLSSSLWRDAGCRQDGLSQPRFLQEVTWPKPRGGSGTSSSVFPLNTLLAHWSTCSGVSVLRCAVETTVETLVPGIHKYLLSNFEIRGNITSWTLHQLRWSSERESGEALWYLVTSSSALTKVDMGCWTLASILTLVLLLSGLGISVLFPHRVLLWVFLLFYSHRLLWINTIRTDRHNSLTFLNHLRSKTYLNNMINQTLTFSILFLPVMTLQ